jgi:hypothetical protein
MLRYSLTHFWNYSNGEPQKEVSSSLVDEDEGCSFNTVGMLCLHSVEEQGRDMVGLSTFKGLGDFTPE